MHDSKRKKLNTTTYLGAIIQAQGFAFSSYQSMIQLTDSVGLSTSVAACISFSMFYEIITFDKRNVIRYWEDPETGQDSASRRAGNLESHAPALSPKEKFWVTVKDIFIAALALGRFFLGNYFFLSEFVSFIEQINDHDTEPHTSYPTGASFWLAYTAFFLLITTPYVYCSDILGATEDEDAHDALYIAIESEKKVQKKPIGLTYLIANSLMQSIGSAAFAFTLFAPSVLTLNSATHDSRSFLKLLDQTWFSTLFVSLCSILFGNAILQAYAYEGRMVCSRLRTWLGHKNLAPWHNTFNRYASPTFSKINRWGFGINSLLVIPECIYPTYIFLKTSTNVSKPTRAWIVGLGSIISLTAVFVDWSTRRGHAANNIERPDKTFYEADSYTPYTRSLLNKLTISCLVCAGIMFEDGMGWELGAIIARDAFGLKGVEFNADLLGFMVTTGICNATAVFGNYLLAELVARKIMTSSAPKTNGRIMKEASLVATSSVFSGMAWQFAAAALLYQWQVPLWSGAIGIGFTCGATFFLAIRVLRKLFYNRWLEDIQHKKTVKTDLYNSVTNMAANAFFAVLNPPSHYHNSPLTLTINNSNYFLLLLAGGALALTGASTFRLATDLVLSYFDNKTGLAPNGAEEDDLEDPMLPGKGDSHAAATYGATE